MFYIAPNFSSIANLNDASGILSSRLYSTGSNLYTYITNTSGNLDNRLYQTGQNLATRLYQTGFDLRALITAAANGVSTINGISGVIDIVGTGEVYVQTIGQTLVISGNSGNYATNYFLTATGATLYNLINSYTGYQNTNPSGFITSGQTGQFYPMSNPNNFSTSGNLQSTGSTLNNNINSLSGFVGNLQRVSAINVTGFGNQTGIINMSGAGNILVSTGLGNFIYVSGVNLITTSQTGQFYPASNPQNYATSGNLQSTGQNLYSYITNTSGNLSTRLYQTGVDIITLINASAGGVSSLNNASGIISLTGAGNVTVISGGVGLIYVSGDTGIYSSFYQNSNPNNYATSGNVQTTGQAAWNTAHNNAINLSGNLTQTGVNLGNKIDFLSGFVRNTSISVTGFSPAFTGSIGMSGRGNVTVFTGINNNIIISGTHNDAINLSGILTTTGQTLYNYITSTSGNLSTRLYQTGNTLLGLISAASAGVSSLDGKSGILILTGAGNVTVIVDAQTLTVSGNTGIYSSFYQQSNPNNYATSGNLQTTGQSAWNAANSNAINLSGNLTNTGAALHNRIISLSGFFTGNTGQFYPASNPQGYAMSGNLQDTGQALYNYVTTTSGNLSARLYQTGVNLINLINASAGGVSSLNNASGILSITGKGNVTVISGGVGLIYISGDTGIYSSFYQQSNPNNYCTSGNLQSTGISLQSQINNLNNATGYINTNPSGFITQNNADNRFVHLTGNENINGLKVFSGAIFSGYFSGYSLTGHNIRAINRITVPVIGSSDGDDAINLVTRTLEDTSPDSSLDWANKRLLRGNSEGDVITVDWYNRILSGTWNVLGGIRTSGAALITGISTGYFISTSQTGQFYPASNPQQYITSGNVSTISGILSDRIYSTGQTLNNKINTLSGYINSSGSNIVYTTGDQTIGGDKIFSPDSYFIVYDSAPGINVIDVGTDDHFVLRSNTDSNDSIDVSNRKLIGSWNINNVSGYVTTGFLQTGIIGQNFIKSNKINFKQTGLYNLYTVPNNHFFMIDEMEILTSNLSNAGDAPYIKFGNLTNDQEYQIATQTTSNSQYSRHIFANPQDAITGGNSLIFTIATGSTAVMHSGYGIIKGYLIQDN